MKERKEMRLVETGSKRLGSALRASVQSFSRRKLVRRVVSGTLAMSMVLTTALANVGITAWADENEGIVRVADPATDPQSPKLLGENGDDWQSSVGKVWTDKSVYTSEEGVEFNGETYTPEGKNDFVEVFSALGSAKAIQDKTPIDLSLILDITSSELTGLKKSTKDNEGKVTEVGDENHVFNLNEENKGAKSNLGQVLKSANKLIKQIKTYSEDSRVSVTVFWGTGEEIISLEETGNCTPQFTSFETFVDNKGNGLLEARLNFSLGDKEGTYDPEKGELTYKPSGSKTVQKLWGGTNYQGGIVAGMKPLAEAKNVTWKEGHNRVPAVVILGDGKANHVLVNADDGDYKRETGTSMSGNWWNNDADGLGYKSASATEYYGAADAAAILSAAYYKAAIADHYGCALDEVNVFTISFTAGEEILGLNPEYYAKATEGMSLPAEDNLPGTDKNNAYLMLSNMLESESNINNWYVPYAGGYSGSPESRSRSERIYKFNYPVGNEPTNAFKISGDKLDLVYPTEFYPATDGESLSKQFDKIFEKLTDPIAPTAPIEPTGGITYRDPIGQYMEVKRFRKVLLFGEKHDVQPNGQSISIVENGKTYNVQSYKLDGTTTVYNKQYATKKNPDGEPVDLSKDITIEVWTPVGTDGKILPGDYQELRIQIAANALPIQTVTVEKTGSEETKIDYTPVDPLRVIYDVGPIEDLITDDDQINIEMLDKEYIDSHKDENDDIYFLTNYYDAVKSADATFTPNDGNTYYNDKTGFVKKKTNSTLTSDTSSSWSKKGNEIDTDLGNNGKLTGKMAGSLLVGKIVAPGNNKNAIPTEQEFTFRIQLRGYGDRKFTNLPIYEFVKKDSNDPGTWEPTENVYPELKFDSNGIAEVILKHNEAILIEGIKHGTQFSVNEPSESNDFKPEVGLKFDHYTDTNGTLHQGNSKFTGNITDHRAVLICTNSYNPYVLVDLPGTKTMDDGSSVGAGEFSFTVTPDSDNGSDDPVTKAYQVYNKEGGDIDLFDPDGDGEGLKFTAEGTYKYVVREDAYKDVPGIYFDNREFTVTVTITSHEDGTAGLRAFVITDGDMHFVNKYNYKDVTLALGGLKVMKNLELEAGDFTFVLEAGEAKIEPATTNNARVRIDDGVTSKQLEDTPAATPGSANSDGVQAPGHVGDTWTNLSTAVKIGTLMTAPAPEETTAAETEASSESTDAEVVTETTTESAEAETEAAAETTSENVETEVATETTSENVEAEAATETTSENVEAEATETESESADAETTGTATMTQAGDVDDDSADNQAESTIKNPPTLSLPEHTETKNAEDGSFRFDPITFTRPGTYQYTVKEIIPEPENASIKYAKNEEHITVKVVRDAITGQLSIDSVTHDETGNSLVGSNGAYTFDEVKFVNEYDPPVLISEKEQQKNNEEETKNPITVVDGDTITYYLSVTNKDEKKTAYDLTIVDPVPTGLEVIEGSIGSDRIIKSFDKTDGSLVESTYPWSYANGRITWTLSELPAKETWTVWFKVKVLDANKVLTWANNGYVTNGNYTDPSNPDNPGDPENPGGNPDPRFFQETNTVYAGEGVPKVTIEKLQSLDGVEFTDKLLQVEPGDKVTYKLIVKSIGSEDALDVYVKDCVPDGLIIDESSIRPDGTLLPDRRTIQWHFDVLKGKGMTAETTTETSIDGNTIKTRTTTTYKPNENGEGDTVELTFNVTVPEVKEYTSWENVATTHYRNNPENPKDPEDPNYPEKEIPSHKVTIETDVPDVSIEKSQSRNGGERTKAHMTVYSGDTVTYYLTVRNTGKGAALGVTVTDTVPFEPVPLTLVPGSYGDAKLTEDAQGHQVLTWTIERIPAGEKAEVSFSVTIPDGNNRRTWKNIGSTHYDNNPKNPEDPGDPEEIPSNEVTIGEDVPNVIIEKAQSRNGGEHTKDSMRVYGGDTVTYYLTVRNTGKAAALGVTVTDTVPYEPVPLTLVDGSYGNAVLTQDAQGHQVLTWTIPSIAPGAEAEVSFSVTIPGGNNRRTWKNIGSTYYENNPKNPDPTDPNYDPDHPYEDIPSDEVVIEKYPTTTPGNPGNPDNPGNPGGGPGTEIPDNPTPLTTFLDNPVPLSGFENIEDEDVPLAFLAPMTGDTKPVGAAALFALIALGMMGAFGIKAFRKDEEE